MIIMNRWAMSEDGVYSLVGERKLHQETAVFQYPIAELRVPYYGEIFYAIAELAVAGASQKITLFQNDVRSLPELLAADQRAVASFKYGQSIEEIVKNGLGNVLGFHYANMPYPLPGSFVDGSRRPAPIYIKSLSRSKLQIWDRSLQGTEITANWQRAFEVNPGSVSQPEWDTVIGIPS